MSTSLAFAATPSAALDADDCSFDEWDWCESKLSVDTQPDLASDPSDSTLSLASQDTGKMALWLVRDHLQAAHLTHSLSVFDAEADCKIATEHGMKELRKLLSIGSSNGSMLVRLLDSRIATSNAPTNHCSMDAIQAISGTACDRKLSAPSAEFMCCASTAASSVAGTTSCSPHAVAEDAEQYLLEKSAHVLTGTVVEMKFSNTTARRGLIWLNCASRSICLSKHATRDRSHKQARLKDIVTVDMYPSTFSTEIGPDGEAGCCLRLSFLRGGEVELKFQSAADRDDWQFALFYLLDGLQKEEEARKAVLKRSVHDLQEKAQFFMIGSHHV